MRYCAGAVLAGITLLVQPAAAFAPSEAEPHIVEQTNAFRQAKGLEPVDRNEALAAAARAFAGYMAKTGRYGHAADGRRPAERAMAEGYDPCIVAENIGYQYRSAGFDSAEALARALVEGWKGSPEHRENMLDPALREVGVGVAQGEGGRHFGVQLFGRPRSAAIRFEVRNLTGQPIDYRVGEQTYALEAHALRRHLRCRPAELGIGLPARGQAFAAQAEDGTRYTVFDDRVESR